MDMKSDKPGAGLLVAGINSDCGKTTVTLGLMAALRVRGLRVQPFKCGPDFIDPSLHREVCGRLSRNLDLNMCEADYVTGLYDSQAARADISVVEGVMGMFDGGVASSAALAKVLAIPIVLLVDVRAMAESVAALVKGYTELDPDCRVVGVILNRVGSPRHEDILRRSIAEHCRVAVVGAVPRNSDFTLPGRHLGLHMGEEGVLDREKIAAIAGIIESGCDLDYLVKEIGPPDREPVETPAVNKASAPKGGSPVKIGVARDSAFCFYYEDNLDIIRRAGGEVVYFSPLGDDDLPGNLDGIYLGGGYPELYGSELAANTSMISRIRRWSQEGRPLYAECGGFMYLTEGIDDGETSHPMAGVFPVKARLGKRLTRLGYRRVSTTRATILGPAGSTLRGHEFHYSDIGGMPSHIGRAYILPDGGREGYVVGNTLAGYYHLHFGSTPEAARYFLDCCRGRQEKSRVTATGGRAAD